MATTEVGICNIALSEIGANTITSLTANSVKEDRLCNQFYSQIRDELLRSFAWNFALKTTPLNLVNLYDTSDAYSDAVTITNVATLNPVAVTAANNYATGMIVRIWDINGTDELNDLDFEIASASTGGFTLLGVDGGKYTVYSSGGYAVRHEPLTMYDTGYAYTVPTDCLKALRLDSDAEFEIFGDNYNGRRLLTVDNAATLVYISQVTDVTKFPDDFVRLLVERLKLALVMPIIGAKDGAVIKRELYNDLKMARSAAQKNNCHEHTKLYGFKSTWANARK